MAADVQEAGEVGPVDQAQPQRAPKLSWREERWERRRRRIWFEEVLAWILVPVILIACWWAFAAGLEALGTSPAALWQGVQAVLGQL